jgi:hypothetical protein
VIKGKRALDMPQDHQEATYETIPGSHRVAPVIAADCMCRVSDTGIHDCAAVRTHTGA